MADRERAPRDSDPRPLGGGASGDPAADPVPPEATAAPTPEELLRLRERIDEIDAAIVALLDERARIALQVGRVKQAAGRRAVRDAAREAEVIERVTGASAGLFPEPELVALYRKLIAATRRVQHAQRRSGSSTGAGSEGGIEAGHETGAPDGADDR